MPEVLPMHFLATYKEVGNASERVSTKEFPLIRPKTLRKTFRNAKIADTALSVNLKAACMPACIEGTQLTMWKEYLNELNFLGYSLVQCPLLDHQPRLLLHSRPRYVHDQVYSTLICYLEVDLHLR